MGCSLFGAMFEPLCYFINIIGEDVFNKHICFLWFFGRKDDDMLWRLRSSSSMLSLCCLMILGGGLDKTLPQPKPRRSRMVNITLSEPPLTFLSRVCL